MGQIRTKRYIRRLVVAALIICLLIAVEPVGRLSGWIAVSGEAGQSRPVPRAIIHTGLDRQPTLVNRVSQPFPGDYVPNELLVQFDSKLSGNEIVAIVASQGVELIREFRHPKGLIHIRLPEDMSVDAAILVFTALPEVKFAEPNIIYYSSILPDDPHFKDQWALKNDGQERGMAGYDIDAPAAWDLNMGSRSVILGVTDTGIDYTHTDLTPNIWTNPNEVAANGIDDDGNGYVDDIHGIDVVNGDSDPMDDSGHGTHVAGTIAARANDGTGVAGVMWSASIIACKFISSEGWGTLAGAIECLNYYHGLKQSGIDIIATNNSWGGGLESQSLLSAIQQHEDSDILFVAAAGNSDVDLNLRRRYPASYNLDSMIVVAASNRHGKLAWFTNWGNFCVDIVAPGVDILSTIPGNEWAYASGTSMAAPHVTGAIGLIKAGAPHWTGMQIKERLLTTGRVVEEDKPFITDGVHLLLDIPFTDTDGDGIADVWETDHGLNAGNAADAAFDPDGDGASNLSEFLNRTDPANPDTDHDGATDGLEINTLHSNPLVADSDDDGLDDGNEHHVHGTDSTQSDSDDDGLTDGQEIQDYRTDPNNADSDGDQFNDGWEIEYGFDPLNSNEGSLDSDGDSLTDWQEFLSGSSPNTSDTDSDGLGDAKEASETNTDPALRDSDGDKIEDGWEIKYGSDPLNDSDGLADSDGDGFNNFQEFKAGTDPTDPDSRPVLYPWQGFQSNAGHTGSVPVNTWVDAFETRWAYPTHNGYPALYQAVMTATQITFIQRHGGMDYKITSHALFDGEPVWGKEFAQINWISAPAFSREQIYVAVQSIGGETNLFALDEASGDVNYSILLPDAGRTVASIVSHEDELYVVVENRIYAFNAADGTELWMYEGHDYASSMPAVSEDYLAIGGDNALYLHDRDTGELLLTSDAMGCYASAGQVVHITEEGYLLWRSQNCLVRLSPVDGSVLWKRLDVANASIAISNGVVFVHRSGYLFRWDAETGADIGELVLPAWGQSPNVVVSYDHAFVSDNDNTYAIDLNTNQIVWTVHHSGSLHSSGSNALAIVSNKTIELVDLEQDWDADGLPSWWEKHYRLNSRSAEDAQLDADADGLANLEEYQIGSDPLVMDSDGDGITDYQEFKQHGTYPLEPDSDNDGLSDGEELKHYFTGPLTRDSDDDGLPDGMEVRKFSSDPVGADDSHLLPATWSESFENGLLAGWAGSSDTAANWEIDDSRATDGRYSLKSPNIFLNSTQVEWKGYLGAGELGFDVYFQRGSSSSTFEFYVDGDRAAIISDTDGSWVRVNTSFVAGEHILRWVINKSYSGTSAMAWIDNVQFTQPTAFAATKDNILVLMQGELHEHSPSGEALRAPMAIKGVQDTLSFAPAFAITHDHRLVFGGQEKLIFYDPVSGVKSDIPIGRSGPCRAARLRDVLALDDKIYALDRSAVGGILVFDLNGICQGRYLRDKHYFLLIAGRDGYLYGSLDQDSSTHDVIDPVTLEVVRSLTLDGFDRDIIAVNEEGIVFSVDGWRSVEAFRFSRQGVLEFRKLLAEGIELSAGRLTVSDSGVLNVGLSSNHILIASGDFQQATLLTIPSQNSVYASTYALPFEWRGQDTDGDGIADWWERLYGLNRKSAADAPGDADADGVDNRTEFKFLSNPRSEDTDGDGVSDAAEIYNYGSDPAVTDSDKDGIEDGVEVDLGTNPADPDTDLDGLSDADEINVWLTNPLQADTDNDGLNDGWEVSHDFDPLSPVEGQADRDGDGLDNEEEQLAGSDPEVADTDGDGISDGDEVNIHLTDPLSKDSDGDLISDLWELNFQLDPNDSMDAAQDADDDGFTNYEEFLEPTNPLNADFFPAAGDWYTYKGSRLHRGYVPLSIEPDAIALRWELDLGSVDPYLVFNSAATVDDKILITANVGDVYSTLHGFMWVIGADTGEILWRYEFLGARTITPAAYANGKIYVQSYEGDLVLWAFDVDTGVILFKSAVDSQYHFGDNPVPYQEDVYVPGLTYGGLLSIDGNSGKRNWSFYIEAVSGFTAAVDGDRLFLFDAERNRGLVALDRYSGEISFRIDESYAAGGIPMNNRAPIIGNMDSVLFSRSDQLVNYDLAQKKVAWRRDGTYRIQPVVANGVIYGTDGPSLLVMDETTGTDLWKWAPESLGAFEDLLATRNHILMADSTRIYVIDLETRQSITKLDFGGAMTIGKPGHLVVVSRTGQVKNVSLQMDADLDGLPGVWERRFGMSDSDSIDASVDEDDEGLNALEEYYAGTSPRTEDLDGDGVDDSKEVKSSGSDPRLADTDGDGLDDGYETQSLNSSPLLRDTDEDGLPDATEVPLLTSPVSKDTDGDGYSDKFEYFVKTNPGDATSIPALSREMLLTFSSESDLQSLVQDESLLGRWSTLSTDWYGPVLGVNMTGFARRAAFSLYVVAGDDYQIGFDCTLDFAGDLSFYVDGELIKKISRFDSESVLIDLTAGPHELRWEYQRVRSGSEDDLEVLIDNIKIARQDWDKDGIPDHWENAYQLNPRLSDSEQDLDNDGLTNLEEYTLGTYPDQSDSDNDGLNDFWETQYGLSPLSDDSHLDPDDDGYSNMEENLAGTNPTDSASYPLSTDSTNPGDSDNENPSANSSSGGSGGGGSLSYLALLLLLSVFMTNRRQDRRYLY